MEFKLRYAVIVAGIGMAYGVSQFVEHADKTPRTIHAPVLVETLEGRALSSDTLSTAPARFVETGDEMTLTFRTSLDGHVGRIITGGCQSFTPASSYGIMETLTKPNTISEVRLYDDGNDDATYEVCRISRPEENKF